MTLNICNNTGNSNYKDSQNTELFRDKSLPLRPVSKRPLHVSYNLFVGLAGKVRQIDGETCSLKIYSILFENKLKTIDVIPGKGQQSL